MKEFYYKGVDFVVLAMTGLLRISLEVKIGLVLRKERADEVKEALRSYLKHMSETMPPAHNWNFIPPVAIHLECRAPQAKNFTNERICKPTDSKVDAVRRMKIRNKSKIRIGMEGCLCRGQAAMEFYKDRVTSMKKYVSNS